MIKDIGGDEHSLWEETEVFAINIQQTGLNPADPRRVICKNGNDGDHKSLGGALGTMIAGRSALICPCCDERVTASNVDRSFVEAALGNPAMKAPDQGMLQAAEALLAEYESFARANDFEMSGLAFIGVRNLETYIADARKHMAARWGRPSADGFPIRLLLELYNQAPPGSGSRATVIEWLQHLRANNERQHWLYALELNDNGDLSFNQSLYLQTCWRGKQETYFESAAEGYEKLKQGLSLIETFQAREDGQSIALDPTKHPLFPQRALSIEATALKAISPQLRDFNEVFQACSLDTLLTSAMAQRIEHAAAPALPVENQDGHGSAHQE